ncbi:MAG TPA: DUF1579 family protein [Phycisphaerae bacterium]|nr:DUF1579 family protein [Phycisphaerae bacterium]
MLLSGIAIAAAMLFSAGQVLGDEKDSDKGHGAKHGQERGEGHEHGEGHEQGDTDEQVEMDPQMVAWMKYAMPGEHHEYLKPMMGNWNLAIRYRMTAEAEWQEDKATAVFRWILGGRFMMQEVTGEEFMGQRFEGLGIIGYDNYAKKYTCTWQDTMMTMTMITTGTCDSSGKEFTFSGEYDDVVTGKTKKGKSVIRIINENKLVWEGYDTTEDGTEYQSMEIAYTRA